ncbi:quinone-dependent dihydroorotate dehydrogenase [Candidatus Haliotispira prima]|uniref:Dihydroorotate dehydrogenase (quinone) n=1 Tax=Candidatus Haliotispira prima TaxID=3034016 RepID=A0ABY8MG64_9SPIO|nr:quinone-dependent dihydroorotate dehydrogenase [Candidatus Haliotispira prima]
MLSLFLSFLFRILPGEKSYHAVVNAYKFLPAFLFRKPQTRPELSTTFLGKTVPHPIGLAAGFDKQGAIYNKLGTVGFSFVEVGSITPEPQSGNPQPRFFRLEKDEALINRFGFNSIGSQQVRKNMGRNPPKTVLTGFNLGVNKGVEQPIEDYLRGITVFRTVADYYVINISSPNTKDLRDLQNVPFIEKLLAKIEQDIADCPPVLFKLSPDMEEALFLDIVHFLTERHVGGRNLGLIIANTSVARPDSLKSHHQKEVGGLSGRPLAASNTELVAKAYSITRGRIPIIAGGGIFTGQDLFLRLQAGADLVQLLTTFFYNGPAAIQKILREFELIMDEKGLKTIRDIRAVRGKPE